MENVQSQTANCKTQVAIVGAGPAGSSLAIRLAVRGFGVILIERDKFPRHKLCGEFVSPECLVHFSELGVLDDMLAIGGDRISETIFFAPGGRSVSVPSEWFGNPTGALSISRAEMDRRLLDKARAVGVTVFEETQVVRPLFDGDAVAGVKVKTKDGATFDIDADITVDATGRASVVARLVGKLRTNAASEFSRRTDHSPRIAAPRRADGKKLVGFKTHLDGVSLPHGRCEIYFFKGGYGGLSYVEDGRANHCFLIDAAIVRDYIGQTNLMIEEVVFRNVRARETMSAATPAFDWINVAVDGFGVKELTPAPNLFCVGDAAAFIDPFTGSGMLMALESAALLAEVIADTELEGAGTAIEYQSQFVRRFTKRLRICSFLRRAAFMPRLAATTIAALSFSGTARRLLARATRPSGDIKKSNV